MNPETVSSSFWCINKKPWKNRYLLVPFYGSYRDTGTFLWLKSLTKCLEEDILLQALATSEKTKLLGIRRLRFFLLCQLWWITETLTLSLELSWCDKQEASLHLWEATMPRIFTERQGGFPEAMNGLLGVFYPSWLINLSQENWSRRQW